MLESLVIYTLLFAIMFLCGVIASNRENKYIGGSGRFWKNKKFLTIEIGILLLTFTVVFGCRWGVGRDYFRYLYAFTNVAPERFEPLFQILSNFLQKIGAHYSIYFATWAFIDVFLLYYSLRHYRFIFPYIAFFLIFGSYYLPMMNAVRQSISGLLFLLSIEYIDKKQLLKHEICLIIAVLFHKLSIILFIIYPLLRLNDDWFKNITLQIVLFIVAVFLSLKGEIIIQWIEVPFRWLTNVLGYSIYDYDLLTEDRFDRGRFGNNTGFGLIVKIVVTVPIILYSKEFKRYYNSTYINMLYTLYFVGVLTSLLFGQSIILNRIAMFFSIFQLIIHSFFVYYCFDKKQFVHQILGIVILFIQVPLFLNMISNPRSTAPFLFFWQQVLYY